MLQRQDMQNIDGNKTEYHKLKYGDQFISFQLQYSKRKTLEISVYPDLSVRIKAPISRSYDEIKAKVLKRGLWILEQKYFFSMYLPKQPEKRYVSGESFMYLGKQYRLKIVQDKSEQVVLKRGYIFVHLKNRKNSKQIKQLLEQWYRQRASIKFEERLDLCINKLKKHGVNKPKMQIRKMSRRWGSCSEKGKITLNVQLLKASSYCIDYVITHELCHLKYFNHGKAFYKLLTGVMPDWEKRKKRLESISI